MFKLTKKLLNDYNSSKLDLTKSKSNHKKNIDNITEFMKPYFDEKFNRMSKSEGTRINYEISGIKFCYDNSMKNCPNEYEWNEITEDEYDRCKKYKHTNIKEEYDDGSGDFKCYMEERKKQKYLKVYIHESWGGGGYDDLSWDFLLTDIMEDSYVRKEKLLKLEENI